MDGRRKQSPKRELSLHKRQIMYFYLKSFLSCSSTLFCLLSLHGLLFRTFTLNGPKDTTHTLIVGPVFLNLLLLFDASKEASILPKLPDGTLLLLLVLVAQFRCLVFFVVRILSAKIIRGCCLKLGDISGDGDRLMRLETKRGPPLIRELEYSSERVTKFRELSLQKMVRTLRLANKIQTKGKLPCVRQIGACSRCVQVFLRWVRTAR